MKKVLVLGGAPYQVPLIKRIVELGCDAYCLDYNPSSPGFQYATKYAVMDVLDKEVCLAYAKENAVDAVMTFGATLPLPTVAYIGKKMGLPTINSDVAELSLSKFKIKQCLERGGCNIRGEYYLISKSDSINDFVFQKTCVVKPCDGSGSKGVVIVDEKEAFVPAIEYSLSKARYGEAYCEELIRGAEYSVEAFANGDDVEIYAIVKTAFTKNGDGNECIDYGHCTLAGISEDVLQKIRKEAVKAVKALGVTMGSINFDIIVSAEDGQPYIIDTGVRVGQNLIYSHIVPLSRGISVIDNTIYQALGEPIQTKPIRSNCVATRLLIYNPGTIKEIKPMNELIGTNGIADIVMKRKVGDVQPIYKDKSDTCGWVICTGNSPIEAEASAIKAKNIIKDYIVIE